MLHYYNKVVYAMFGGGMTEIYFLCKTQRKKWNMIKKVLASIIGLIQHLMVFHLSFQLHSTLNRNRDVLYALSKSFDM